MMSENEVKAVCSKCGIELYEWDRWKNYLEKMPDSGQDAANKYLSNEDSSICEDCEQNHPLVFYVQDSIMFCLLKEVEQ